MQIRSIWIEAEAWAAGEWTPADDTTGVIVTFDDGSKWSGTFFSYKNLVSLVGKNKQTGECLSGKYLRASDMTLVDEVSRERIEEVVRHLVAKDELTAMFSQCSQSKDEE